MGVALYWHNGMHDVQHKPMLFLKMSERIAELNADMVRDEAIFSNTKDFIEQKEFEIKKLNDDCARLEQKNYQISNKAREAKQITDNLTRVRKEKAEIEQLITNITTSPFLEEKRTGESIAQQRARLETELAMLDRECQKAKAEELMQETKAKELQERLSQIKGENKYI